ncbi:hypothetical protein CAF53_16670 [Sphingobium sp. LB126]|uniref:hypothetical protein n=1 Tax=Sphingobium sp. LB126 TaxID=1983755 RepID=UPI000C20FCB4|nr:hypothetical protein [Sphingobium sp. LB126]PJG45883.1 hypothetical protein CAF53_16670 [Sphingobium sp. LB126]
MPHTNDVLLTVEGAQAAEQRLVKDPLTVSGSEPLRTVPGDDGMVTEPMHAHGAIYGGIPRSNG